MGGRLRIPGFGFGNGVFIYRELSVYVCQEIQQSATVYVVHRYHVTNMAVVYPGPQS